MTRISRAVVIAALALAAACGGAAMPPPGAPERAGAAEAELAPNPYTVYQLRAGCTHRVIEYRMQRAGAPPTDETWAFTDADSESVQVTTSTFDAAGKPIGAPETETAKWVDLHKHADFPRAATTVDADTITTPAGTFDCMRYVVVRGDEVKTYWFARSIAGPPVKLVVTKGGEQVMTLTMQANRTR